MSSKANLTLDEYQERAMETCMASSDNHTYMMFGLCEEVGELMGKVAKAVRKEKIKMSHNRLVLGNETKVEDIEQLKEDIKKELGDVMWMVAGIAQEFEWTLDEVASMNLAKLADRQKRDVIDGSGDNR